MRVSHQDLRRDDRGAVLVIVAAFTLVAVIFLAFVIDIGNQRQNRRQLTTETDAVALTAAKDWTIASLSNTFDDCSDSVTAARLSVSNNPNKNPSADPVCTFTRPNPFQGYVTVTDGEIADYAFDGVTGIPAGNTGSTSTVAISVVPGGGLRPLGLCLLDDTLQQWLLTGTPTQFDIYAPRFLDPACVDGAGSPGNWSQVVLPPSGANQNDWTDDVENGAEEDVTVNQALDNLTGVGMNSAEDEFEGLAGTIFFLPVYSIADRSSGSHVEYPVTGFLEVRLISVDISGSDPSFLIEPLRFQDSGTCCFANEFNTSLTICDVGTIGGAAGANLADNCLATLPPDVTTTTQPDPCTGVLLDPPAANVTLGGSGGRRLTAPLTYTLTVVDADDCGVIEIVIDNGTGAAPTAVASRVGTTDQYTATFATDTAIGNPPESYPVEAFESGGSSLPLAAAVLTTS